MSSFVRCCGRFLLSIGRLRRGVAVFLLLALFLILTASLALASCGRAFVDPVSGRDTPTCGAEDQPCRSLAVAQERASGCDTVTRIFQIQGNFMTLADIVVPAQSAGDHRTPEWLRPIFPFFGQFLKPEVYTSPLFSLRR